MRQLELPFFPALFRTGKSSFLISKKLGFKEMLRYRTAINFDKRLMAPGADWILFSRLLTWLFIFIHSCVSRKKTVPNAPMISPPDMIGILLAII
ncbi:Uncharacterised protein [Mycobacteroides abscessus subsp. abscessus]|nr:Uncharacterised protein [Mycobacteroides abscessus subsp. abscessus]